MLTFSCGIEMAFFALTQFRFSLPSGFSASSQSAAFLWSQQFADKTLLLSLCARARTAMERMNGHIVRRRPIQKTPLSHVLRVKSNQRRQHPLVFFSWIFPHFLQMRLHGGVLLRSVPWQRWIEVTAPIVRRCGKSLGEKHEIILMTHPNETRQMHIAYFIYVACKHALCVTSNEEVSNSKGLG